MKVVPHHEPNPDGTAPGMPSDPDIDLFMREVFLRSFVGHTQSDGPGSNWVPVVVLEFQDPKHKARVRVPLALDTFSAFLANVSEQVHGLPAVPEGEEPDYAFEVAE